MKTKLTLSLIIALVFTTNSAWAVTVDDITQDLDDNYSNISDLQATITVDSTNNDHDVTSGTIKSKLDTNDTAKNKFRTDSTAPNTSWIICDGTNVNDNGSSSTKTSFVTSTSPNIGWISRGFKETDILWILDNHNFTLANSNSVVNEVTCKKIYCDDYDIYVDESEYAKIIRIDRKVSDVVTRRYDFDSYTYIESTAWFSTEQESTDFSETYTSTLSSININENLSDSVFSVN